MPKAIAVKEPGALAAPPAQPSELRTRAAEEVPLETWSVARAFSGTSPRTSGESGTVGSWQPTPYVVLTVAPILAVAMIAVLHRCSLHRARLQTAPQHLLAELCRRHQFDAGSQRLLRRIAAAARLAQPAELFVFPARFDAAVAAARLRRRQRVKLSRLRRQLFGEQAAAPPEETTSSSSCPSLRSLPS